MSTKMKSTVDTSDVADQMATLRADISTLTSTVAELAKLKGVEVSDAAKEQIATAKSAASAQADLAKQQAAQLHDQVNEFVRTQPATAVGLAAGLGFVIGMLMTRK